MAPAKGISLDDYYKIKSINSAEISPNTHNVVYDLVRICKAKKEECSDLWLYSVISKRSKQITFGDNVDAHPQWSPDSQQIAYLSNRAGFYQIYLYDLETESSKVVTRLEQGVSGDLAWSPDGKKIAFTARKTVKVRNHEHYTNMVNRVDGVGDIATAALDIYTYDFKDESVSQITNDGMNNHSLRWSLDSKKIYFLSNFIPSQFSILKNALKSCDLSGNVRELLNDGWDEIIAFNLLPNGAGIVFAGLKEGEKFGAKRDLWVLRCHEKQPRNLTISTRTGVGNAIEYDMPGLKRMGWPMHILISSDAKYAFARTQIGGCIHVIKVNLIEIENNEVILDGNRAIFPLDIKDDLILYAASDCFNPVDIFLHNQGSKCDTRITNINAEFFTKKKVPQLKNFSFTNSNDNKTIEGWVLIPETTSPPPVVLKIHGGPHVGYGNIFNFDFHLLVGAGYAVVFLNHRGSTGYGNEFATQIQGKWGKHEYEDLMQGLDFAIKEFKLDHDRIGISGLSGGGGT